MHQRINSFDASKPCQPARHTIESQRRGPHRASLGGTLTVLACAFLILLPHAHGQTVQYAFTNFAGMPGGRGDADGVGDAARFNRPSGVTVDGVGNLYLMDSLNFTIRKVTLAGVVTTLAGSRGLFGSADGTGGAARFGGLNFLGFFYGPGRIAADNAGNVYVADTYNHTIRKVTPEGVVTTLAGSPGLIGSADGTGSMARFRYPEGVAVDSAGNVHAADSANHTIRKITPGGVVRTLAGLAQDTDGDAFPDGSYADGKGSTAQFNRPEGVAVDSEGNVYVADAGNHMIRKVTPSGDVTTLAGDNTVTDQFGWPIGSYVDGTGSLARFNVPRGVAVDSAGNVYVADSGNHMIRQMTAAGVVTTLAGSANGPGSGDGTSSAAQFNYPRGVAVDSTGNIYVADTDNHTVRKVTTAGVVTTFAGSANGSGSADGTGTGARFNFTGAQASGSEGYGGVAVDSTGNLYVADYENHTVRKVTPTGVVTTLAGKAGQFGSANGSGSAARFGNPKSVAVDTVGNVYVTDGNYAVRKVTPAGVVTTLAGTFGQPGSADGTGGWARFEAHAGLAVDSAGNVYVADRGNFTVRKITPTGVVTTLAGKAGQSGSDDGTGSTAMFSLTGAIAVDNVGNVYVGNNGAIRKVTPTGEVTTLAGRAGESGNADGVGGEARFQFPYGVAVDGVGDVYVADFYNHTIRKVTSAGVVTTLAGSAGQSGSADGPGNVARFLYPSGLGVDSTGTLYVADSGNNRITQGIRGIVPLRFGGLSITGGALKGTLSGLSVGTTVVLESSLDLSLWFPLRTNTATNLTLEFEDADAANFPRRFYRAGMITP